MLLLLTGLFVGSFASLMIMSLMIAAKRGDELQEKHIKNEAAFNQ
ncbi:hypothetical protein ACWM35_20655 [Neobacillus sp. K501]